MPDDIIKCDAHVKVPEDSATCEDALLSNLPALDAVARGGRALRWAFYMAEVTFSVSESLKSESLLGAAKSARQIPCPRRSQCIRPHKRPGIFETDSAAKITFREPDT